MPSLPELDIARARRSCEHRVPDDARDRVGCRKIGQVANMDGQWCPPAAQSGLVGHAVVGVGEHGAGRSRPFMMPLSVLVRWTACSSQQYDHPGRR